MLINPKFHPYAGMIRIRLEGIISACKRRHPLKSAAKLYKNPRTAKRFGDYFTFFHLSETHTSLNNIHHVVAKFLTLVDEVHVNGTNGVSILMVVHIGDIL